MKRMKKLFHTHLFYYLLGGIGILASLVIAILLKPTPSSLSSLPSSPSPTPAEILTPTPTSQPLPQSKILPTTYHIFQSFNNCGPAALSMALRFYGISISQQELGVSLRPFQVPGGDNDDKSVTLEELAEKSKEYGFTPYHRPNGSVDIIKHLIALDLPVITRTLLTTTEDIGHYRVIKGYNEETQSFIQDDSLQGKDLSYSYSDYLSLWKKFNYEYLVLVPQEKQQQVEQLLGEDVDSNVAWGKAVEKAQSELAQNPSDTFARFNLAVAYYHSGEYEKTIEEFEKVENQLSFRTLWYQIEPIEAYFHLGQYERVFQLTEKILNNHNRAFSELYLLRGQIYQTQGNSEAAKAEYEKAVYYNRNLKKAQELLSSL